MKKLFILLLVSMVCLQTYAVPADPTPVTVTQPNGDELTLIMKGDEFINYAETLDGYTLLINSEFYFCYAQLNISGDLEPSSYSATEIQNRPYEVVEWLQTINKNLFYSEKQVYKYTQIREIYVNEQDRGQNATTGLRKLLIIFMEFSDRPAKKTPQEFELLFNQINYFSNGFKGSVKDFFLESSYNKLELQCTVVGPFLAPQNANYYVKESMWNVFARHSIDKAISEGVDFTPFISNDNIIESVYIIYAGHDQSKGCGTCIWAHAQQKFNYNSGGFLFKQYAASSELMGSGTPPSSTIATIGTFCHEFGHSLGAPDYYDTNDTDGGKYDGTGDWDLQASGSHNNDGKRPATPNPRSKVYTYGWATAIELNVSQKCTIPVSRIYSNAYFRINTSEPNLYFIIENKKREGFDEYVPGNNLLIYKCTDPYETNGQYSQNTTSWQRFYPVSANATVKVPEAGTNKKSQYGNINISTCAWPQTNKKDFDNNSIPGMVTWNGTGINKPIKNIVVHDDFITFDFMGGGNKTKFNIFLPAYYGCEIIPQPGSSSPVNSGESFSFQVDLLPTHNKSNIEVYVNNTQIFPIIENIYKIYNITDDQIIKIKGIEFNTNTITATAKENGKITPNGEIKVNVGGLQKFDITPDRGYSIDMVIVDWQDKGNISEYTFTNVNEPHTIQAIFKRGDTYTINSSEQELFFETYAGVPSESAEIIISSPDVIDNVSVNAPNRFQVSSDKGKNWQQGFSLRPNQLPFSILVRFAPKLGMDNVGTFDTVLTLKSTDAYSEIKLTGLSHVGINENVNENTIVISPNPTTGQLKIENGQLKINNVEVFDIYGRKVLEPSLTVLQSYDLTVLSAGIYLMKIYTDIGIVHKKVVKE